MDLKLKVAPLHAASLRRSFRFPAAAPIQQLSPVRKVLDAFSCCALAIGTALLVGCGGSLSNGSGKNSSEELAPFDLTGQRRAASPTMGAFEAEDEADTAENSVIASVAMPQTASRSLQVSWQPFGNNASGYMVYFGKTTDTANVFVSDLATGSGLFDPKAPTVTYDSTRELGLYAGDTACFRIHAYDSARALSSLSTLVCTAV